MSEEQNTIVNAQPSTEKDKYIEKLEKINKQQEIMLDMLSKALDRETS